MPISPFDGANRRRHATPPLEALARGPVWVLDEISARRYAEGTRADIVTRDGVSGINVYGRDHESWWPFEQVRGYETVTVIDPETVDPFGRRLWDGCEAGDELVFVWIESGDFD